MASTQKTKSKPVQKSQPRLIYKGNLMLHKQNNHRKHMALLDIVRNYTGEPVPER